MDILGLIAGALIVLAVVAARTAYGWVQEHTRKLQELFVWSEKVDGELLQLQERVQRNLDSLAAIGTKANFAQDSVLKWPHYSQLEKLGKAADLIGSLDERMTKLEARTVETHLEVMDKAEKVAARLADRERKRATAAREPVDDHTIEDEAEWWARARAAHPLPGMPPVADERPVSREQFTDDQLDWLAGKQP